MPYVGDLIMALREAATDLPIGQLTLPGAEVTIAAGGNVAGSTLPQGNYYARVSYLNPWGETLAKTATAVIVVDAAHTVILVSWTAFIPPGVTQLAVYFGPSATGMNQRVLIPVVPGTAGTYNISALGSAAVIPQRNSAYMPDSDGRALNAAAVIRWLNDGMRAAAAICGGGLPNLTGVPSVQGQPLYQTTGNWKKILNAWYDGYPMYLGSKSDISRRGRVSGYGGIICADVVANRTIVELYPQPARTAGATTLSAPLGLTGTSATLTLSNFVLPFGLAMIGTEIVAFMSNSAGQMTGLIRALGGTLAAAWPAGTAVTELNVMIDGLLVPTDYNVGDAYQTLFLPPGWEHTMGKYLLSRFREAEQNGRESTRLLQEFQTELSTYLRSNRQVAGPIQIRAGGKRGTEVAIGFGSPFGGVIIP